MTGQVLSLAIQSPSQGVWHLGPVPIRGYALAIILGIVASIWIGERRWQARGGRAGEVQDLAVWARGLADAAGADAGPGGRERMHAAFRASSEHELAFWDAAWRSA